jgi:hypothetical protein
MVGAMMAEAAASVFSSDVASIDSRNSKRDIWAPTLARAVLSVSMAASMEASAAVRAASSFSTSSASTRARSHPRRRW